MKLLIKLLLNLSICAAIVVMVAIPASVQSNSSNTLEATSKIEATIDISNIELGKKAVLLDGSILTPISKEEYISRLADEKDISYQEAYRMVNYRTEILSLEENEYFYDYTKRFTYSDNSDFKADLQATLIIYENGSFRSINDVVTVSSRRASGLYDYDWIQTDKYSVPRKGSDEFPVTSVTIGTKGYFEVRSSVELDVSVDLPGFSIGGGSSEEYIYFSETMSMRSTISVY